MCGGKEHVKRLYKECVGRGNLGQLFHCLRELKKFLAKILRIAKLEGHGREWLEHVLQIAASVGASIRFLQVENFAVTSGLDLGFIAAGGKSDSSCKDGNYLERIPGVQFAGLGHGLLKFLLKELAGIPPALEICDADDGVIWRQDFVPYLAPLHFHGRDKRENGTAAKDIEGSHLNTSLFQIHGAQNAGNLQQPALFIRLPSYFCACCLRFRPPGGKRPPLWIERIRGVWRENNGTKVGRFLGCAQIDDQIKLHRTPRCDREQDASCRQRRGVIGRRQKLDLG